MGEATLEFDPIATVIGIFNERHPGLQVNIYWLEGLAGNVPGWGMCLWGDEENDSEIHIDPVLPFNSLVETLAHELAHVAAGEDAGHGPVWEEVFGGLFAAYSAIVSEREKETASPLFEWNMESIEESER